MDFADPLRTRRPFWVENILCPSLDWGVGGTFENLDWWIQPDGRYGGVDVPWSGSVPTRLAYLPRSPENAHATVHRVRDDLLWEHCLLRDLSLSDYQHILCDHLVNRMDCALDDIWDKPVVE